MTGILNRSSVENILFNTYPWQIGRNKTTGSINYHTRHFPFLQDCIFFFLLEIVLPAYPMCRFYISFAIFLNNNNNKKILKKRKGPSWILMWDNRSASVRGSHVLERKRKEYLSSHFKNLASLNKLRFSKPGQIVAGVISRPGRWE